MTARLGASVEVSALIRRIEGLGGNAAVLARGDATGGTILLVMRERGGKARFLARSLKGEGRYRWGWMDQQPTENEQEISDFIARRRRFDPDLWALELDIAGMERFAAEMIAEG